MVWYNRNMNEKAERNTLTQDNCTQDPTLKGHQRQRGKGKESRRRKEVKKINKKLVGILMERMSKSQKKKNTKNI